MRYLWPFAFCTVTACSAASIVESRIISAGTVVKEYENEGYKYFVVKAGHRYVKYAYAVSDATIVGYLYEVDTVIRACMWQSVRIECGELARDPDLAPYITWLERPAVSAPPSSAPPPAAPDSAPAPAPAAAPE